MARLHEVLFQLISPHKRQGKNDDPHKLFNHVYLRRVQCTFQKLINLRGIINLISMNFSNETGSRLTISADDTRRINQQSKLSGIKPIHRSTLGVPYSVKEEPELF